MNKIIKTVANATNIEPAPVHQPVVGGLADRAQTGIDRPGPPHANRGGYPPHADFSQCFQSPTPEHVAETDTESRVSEGQATPPRRRRRLHRKKVTDGETMEFLARHARFDWLAVTIPNPVSGKGSKSEDMEPEERENQETHGVDRCAGFAAAMNLYEIRMARGSDGFHGAMHLNQDRFSRDRQVTIRAGHQKNMPSLEITGGDHGHRLAVYALKMMGVLLASRIDVCMDISQNGLFDRLFDIAMNIAANDPRGRMAPPRLIDQGSGRSFTFGGSNKKGKDGKISKPEFEICVYQKGYEMAEKGKILPEDIDRNWVRIELRIRPQKEKKSGIARVAQKAGPAALFGTCRWVREFTEKMILAIGVTDDPSIAVTRLENRPDPRTARDKIEEANEQYSRLGLEAALVEIVDERFDGDFDLAEKITDQDLIDRAIQLISQSYRRIYLKEKPFLAASLIDRTETDRIRCEEERAVRLAERLESYIDWQHRLDDRAQSMLTRIYNNNRRRFESAFEQKSKVSVGEKK